MNRIWILLGLVATATAGIVLVMTQTKTVSQPPQGLVSPTHPVTLARSGPPGARPVVNSSTVKAVSAPVDYQKIDVNLKGLQESSTRQWTVTPDSSGNFVKTLSRGAYKAEGATPKEKAQNFVNEYAQTLFGVQPESLEVTGTNVTDRTRITLGQQAGGYPIYGTYLDVTVEGDQITHVQNNLFPCNDCAMATQPDFPQDQAQAVAMAFAAGKGGSNDTKPNLSQIVAFPSQGQLFAAYVTRVSAAPKSPDVYQLMIDAHTGQVMPKQTTDLTNY